MRRVTIILPTYNEGDNISPLIKALFAQQTKTNTWDIHILVVDSKSQDQTIKEVRDLQKQYNQLHLLLVEKEGLGKAYMHGFSYALEKLNSYVIFEMDADLSHNPEDVLKFLGKIEKGADFVIGSRYTNGGSIPDNWGIHRKIQSIMGNLVIRFGFMKLRITDWTSGYRAIKSWVVKNAFVHIKNYSGYVFQIAFLNYAIKNKARIEEIPIHFKDRVAGKSKINSIQYIFQILLYVFMNSSFIKFVIVGLIGFAIDFGVSYLLIEKARTIVWTATLISTEIAIVSNFLLNNFWSFAHKKIESTKKDYTFSFFKFNLVSSGSILIQTVGIQLLVNILGKQWWYLYKVLIIFLVIIPYSYILYNKFIWKEK